MSHRISFTPAVEDRDIEITVTVTMKESVLRTAHEAHRLGEAIRDEFSRKIGNTKGVSVYDEFEASL